MGIIKAISDGAIDEAAAMIRGGDIVVFPTETVYGIGANALDGMAVAKIFAAKNRPAINPLIVHVTDAVMAGRYVEIDARAQAVMAEFWPGPLTIILPKKAGGGISDLVSAGLDTVGVRAPAHPAAQKLIAAAGVPVAAPSANSSGEPSATTPRHVQESLGGRVPFILAGGACAIGLESTVLDLSEDVPRILRPGAIGAEDLEPLLGKVEYDLGGHDRPRSPGQLLKHYAPRVPVRLRAVDVAPDEALLAFGSVRFMGIKGGGAAKDLPEDRFRNLSAEGDLNEAAANLFTMLRDLDREGVAGIAVMDVPKVGLGTAINDRLARAAQGR